MSITNSLHTRRGWLWLFAVTIALAACGRPPDAASQPGDEQALASTGERYSDYEIVTLLPRDAIPAIDNPQFLSAAEADDYYAPDELILGVEFDGDARAYSVPLLSSHEIVNDTVGGRHIAVTW